ncbi:MAG: ABC-F family ATP-binding cassette domain-containing protein [Chloroflexota bacterium]
MTLMLQANSVLFFHGGRRILDGASVEIHPGDRIALIGGNGAGKSTLFRLLAGHLPPSMGAVTRSRGVTLGMLEQRTAFPPGTTVREVIAAASGDLGALEAQARGLETDMGAAADDDELAAILDRYNDLLERIDRALAGASDESAGLRTLAGLGFPESRLDESLDRMSGGEGDHLLLAALLVERPDVLLLDEPDNHLDFAAKAWLEETVGGYRGAVAVISHDRWFIDRVATRILELEDGQIAAYPGGYADYRTTKMERLVRASQLRDLQEREYRKLKASAEQLTQWARQNPKFASRAENMRRKLAEERERLDATARPVLERRQIDVAFAAERGSTLVLEADGAAKSYAGREVLRPFDLVIRHGEAVGLVGANGSGKTTLFRLVLGLEKPDAGTLRVGPSVITGYYAQEQETLDPELTPLEAIRKLKPMTEQAAIGFLGSYLFTREEMIGRIRDLSGGERARLQIAGLILQGANFLLLDEPTNNLDLASIERLEEALTDFRDAGQGTILAISHDRAFLDAVCTRTLGLDDGELRDYPGGGWRRRCCAGVR